MGRHIRFIELGKAAGGDILARKNSGHSGQLHTLRPAKALRFRIDEAGLLRAAVSASSGEFNLSPEIVHLLCLLQQGVRKTELADRLKADFKQIAHHLPDKSEVNELIEDLKSAQCLISDEAKETASGIEDGFGDAWIQWAMLADTVRCQAYQKAIAELVSTHSQVLDIGAGSGLLSLFALEAGAKSVDAVEETSIVRTLRSLKESLPAEKRNRLSIQNCNSFDAQFREDVGVVVSELFGNDPFQEGVVPTLRDVFSRIKTKKCIGIPESFTLAVQLIDIVGGPLQKRVQMMAEISTVAGTPALKAIHRIKKLLTLDEVSFSHPVRFSEIRTASERKNSIHVPLAPPPSIDRPAPQQNVELISTSLVSAPVVMIGFRVQLTKQITISNMPGEKDVCEHWSPILVPLNRTIQKGERLQLRLDVTDSWDRVRLAVNDAQNKRLGARK